MSMLLPSDGPGHVDAGRGSSNIALPSCRYAGNLWPQSWFLWKIGSSVPRSLASQFRGFGHKRFLALSVHADAFAAPAS